MSLAAGTRLGPYEIELLIGAGGMGEVYKARDTRLGRTVAIKVLPPVLAADPDRRRRFEQEARAVSALNHPHICTLYDVGSTSPPQAAGGMRADYLVMEYLEGQTLADRLAKGPLPLDQALEYATQIADALARAHRQGIVHRDLKPGNVMLAKSAGARRGSPQAKLLDFGLAKWKAPAAGFGALSSLPTHESSMTATGTVVGTLAYMAPEQLEGKGADARSDIFSFGAVLYQMLTGRRAFEGDSQASVIAAILEHDPPPLSSLRPNTPPALERLVVRCLAKDPENRWDSAHDMADELRWIAQGAQPSFKPRRVRALRSWPIGTWLIVVLVALIVAAAAFIAWRVVGNRESRSAGVAPVRARNSVAVVGFDNQTGDSRFDHLRKAIPSLIMTSLENTGRFKVATWERMRDVLKQSGRRDIDIIDAEAGFDVCRREGIAFIVTGSFTKAGDTFATDVKVLDSGSRALIGSATSRGDGETSILRTQIDEIGREIARGLVPSEQPAVVVPPVIDVTTSSMQAYSAYLKGTDALDRFLYEPAIRELRKAVEIDPEFAVAHLHLSDAYNRLGNQKAGDEEVRLAKLHAAKATERERLMIDAKYARQVEGDLDRSISVLKDLVAWYPQDKRAHFDVALAYAQKGVPTEAVASYQRALDLDPNYGLALNGIAFVYLDLGKPDLAIQCLEKYAALSPADPNPVDSLADLKYRLGRLDEAAASYRRAIAIAPDFGSDLQLAALMALEEDYQAALGWADSAIQHATAETRKSDGYALRAIFFQLTGRPDAARSALRQCHDIMARAETESGADVLRGWIDYDNGQWAESRKAFRDARDALQKQAPVESLLKVTYDTFLAAVDQAEGTSRPKLEQFQWVLSGVQPSATRTFPLVVHFSQAQQFCLELSVRRLRAAALATEGKVDEAIALLTPAWPGPIPIWYFDALMAYYLPLAQDHLARLYVQKKDWDRAIAEYKMLTVIGPEHRNRRLIHPIYHYRLAQVYEKKGMKAEAVTEYERFVKLWERATPGRSELEDARKRLANLKRERGM